MTTPARRILFEGGRLRTKAEFYDALERQLALPYFGRNLDALWDVLTTELPGPVEIVWHDAARARAALGEEFERIVGVLRKAAAERADLVLRIE
jgi:ribonuclease inhibitor